MGVEGTNKCLCLINLVSDLVDIYMVGTAPQCLVTLSFSFAVEYLQNLQDTQKMSMKCAVFICHSHTQFWAGVVLQYHPFLQLCLSSSMHSLYLSCRALGFPTEFFPVLSAMPHMAGYLAH